MKTFCLTFLLLLGAGSKGICQEAWQARWISHPEISPEAYTVLHFRNTFTINTLPTKQSLKISAFIRYKLYLNGQYLGQGPANNDPIHYSFDEYAIETHLKQGQNLIAVEVFDLNALNPVRYISDGVKLIVEAEGEMGKLINTGNPGWKVFQNKAYLPTLRGKDFEVLGYYAMGGGEKVSADAYPWGWERANYNDSDWKSPRSFELGYPYGFKYDYGAADIGLSTRRIPMMDESSEARPSLRKVSGLLEKTFLDAWKAQKPLEIPANSEVSFLLDQTYLSKGFPTFSFSEGKDAQIEISYAETLFEEDRKAGNRNEIEGKKFIGLKDILVADGGNRRVFSPLLNRTWRYITLKIKTSAQSLVWDNYQANKFIYPFEEKAMFRSSNPLHRQIWEVGWRTARLCADETYMDCPYYEQLQYIGDTRVQALISLYVSGDDRLMRNALDQFAHSMTDEGITQSRYPAHLLQYIPPYSLFWINMLQDYHMLRHDDAFVKKYMGQVTSILLWFEDKLREDRLLGPMPWWSYVDVTPDFDKSSPPGSWTGGSAVLTLQYLYALQEAIPLLEYFQKSELVQHFQTLSAQIREAVLKQTYVSEKQLFADTPDRDHFSQHANLLAILTNTAEKNQQSDLFQKIIRDTTLSPCNIYFRFYLTRAAQQTGNGDYFVRNMQVWEDMLKEGLTTFAEHVGRTRSDCHAWSASPNYEFLHTVCGIQASKPHFEEVLIAPNLGDLKEASASMPHPKGKIEVNFKVNQGKISGEIILPAGLKGQFIWKDARKELVGGRNVL
ncbi:MAG: alpha-L-rhamnosidase C-terminal domain-containing protein [Microscillaceae bacterium]|nr:alpha-L-rhamnosidase C-terminal domain-containing protein [Microscillaceae bacterium]